MRLRLFKDEQGEPRVWSHGINYTARKHPGAWPKHGAWFLETPRNSLRVEWSWLPGWRRPFSYSIKLDDTSDRDIDITFSIPFLLKLYMGFARCKWLLRLLGLEWESGKHMRDWSRELGISWHSGALWVTPWVNGDYWERGRRGVFSINPVEILFGRKKRRVYDERVAARYVTMPEGHYLARVKLYTAEWRRPRWPFAERHYKAEVEVEGGIPVPGKGENSWDMDDDALYSVGTTATSFAEATRYMYERAMDYRVRYAAANWKPAGGWPDHLYESMA